MMRVKRVTDPLDDKVKARITGLDRTEPDYVSSGSEHSGEGDDDVTELLFGFSESDGGDLTSSPESDGDGDDSDYERDPSVCDSNLRNVDLIERIVADRTDEFRNALEAVVLRGVKVCCGVRSDKQMMRRNVMAFLRKNGYNAAICKTRWERCGGITAGGHEFIDVVAAERYVVDLDFAAEFEIARPTSAYERVRLCLPTVFVGRGEDLRRIVREASDAARRSMKSGGLHLPPWRRNRYVQNKWFGPYRRTANLFPASFCAAVEERYGGVECRAVGFDAGKIDGGRLLATARTR